jgi:threonine dehydrogenase-like Zn-dependent dehydrogenase
VRDTLKEMTAGRGPDAVIDCVGLEAHHSNPVLHGYDRAKQATRAETERGHALRQMIPAVRSGGTVSIVGVYGGFVDKFPIGSLMNRSLTVRTGQTHVHRYQHALLERIERGEIDPSFIITHKAQLSEAPKMYELFKHKQDECLKVVLNP